MAKAPVRTAAPAAPARPVPKAATPAPARPVAAPAPRAAAPAQPAARTVAVPAPAPRAAAPAPARAPQRASAAVAPAAGNGVDPSLLKALKGMKQRWEAAKEASSKGGGGQTSASDGKHECRLTDARLVGGNSGLAFILEFTVVAGDEIGEKCVRYDGLDTDDRIVFFQRDLRRLGLPVDEFDPEQLPQLAEELKALAPLVRMTVKTNGDYKNAYIDKLLSEGEASAEEAAVEEAPAEEEAAVEEAAVEEAAAEGEGEAEEQTEDLTIGDRVAFAIMVANRQQDHTGEVTQIYTNDTADIKNDRGGKVHQEVPLASIAKLVME